MSDYPAGAAHDSRAPYNQPDLNDFTGMCKYCDAQEIERIVHDTTLDDELEQAQEYADEHAGLCQQCLEEQKADMMEDDYKLGLI